MTSKYTANMENSIGPKRDKYKDVQKLQYTYRKIIALCTISYLSVKNVYLTFGAKQKKRTYFLPLFDHPEINIVFSNILKVRSCIANQIYNSKTIL